MKAALLATALFIFGTFTCIDAQEVNTNFADAKSAYNTGDLENTRFALQQALDGINQTIGQEILKVLPMSLGEMSAVDGSDEVSGTNMGFAGLYVGRSYKGDSTSASFQILSDSPLLGSISSMLSMSVFFASDPNQKKIKVHGYKALLTRSEDDSGLISYDVQMPFGDSMLTFETSGVGDENMVTGMLQEIPVDEIVNTAQ